MEMESRRGGRVANAPLSVLLVLGCSRVGGDLVDLRGQLGASLGTDPVGGLYNPDLAGCTVGREAGATTEVYDLLGRQERQVTSTSTVERRFEGLCLVEQVTELQVEEDRVARFELGAACDGGGWPTGSWLLSWGEEGAVEVLDAASYDNAYDEDGRLVLRAWRTASASGRTVLAWAGQRMVLQASEEQVLTQVFDERGLLLEAARVSDVGAAEVERLDYDTYGRLEARVRLGADEESRTEYGYDDGWWPVSVDGEAVEYDCPEGA